MKFINWLRQPNTYPYQLALLWVLGVTVVISTYVVQSSHQYFADESGNSSEAFKWLAAKLTPYVSLIVMSAVAARFAPKAGQPSFLSLPFMMCIAFSLGYLSILEFDLVSFASHGSPATPAAAAAQSPSQVLAQYDDLLVWVGGFVMALLGVFFLYRESDHSAPDGT